MKLLCDQNVSPEVARQFNAEFPGSAHVSHFGLDHADDEEIWRFAARAGFTIITKDRGFCSRSYAYGHPPKVISLQLGNASLQTTIDAIQARLMDLHALELDPGISCLVID